MANAQFVQIRHKSRRIAKRQPIAGKLQAICRHWTATALVNHPLDGIRNSLSPIRDIIHGRRHLPPKMSIS